MMPTAPGVVGPATILALGSCAEPSPWGASAHDSTGNPLWSLTPSNRAQAMSPTSSTDSVAVAAATTVARAALLSSITSYDALHPDRVTEALGPIHPVVLSINPDGHARGHVLTSYDEGAPEDGTVYGLPTTTVAEAQYSADGKDYDPVTTHTGYAATTSGGKTGWALRLATSATTVGAGTGGGDLVTNTRYNDAGQTIQTWLPGSTGSDARSTSTTYNTAGTSGTCVSNTLAGLICSTGPTAQPTTGNPLPVTASTSYNLLDQPLTVTETAGSTVRTNTTTYDTAGRTQTNAVSVTPTAAGGTALPTVTTGYDPSTGLPITTSTTVSGTTTTLTTGYDSLGRAISYTDANGTTSTTSYDISGHAVSVGDGKGAIGYTYDSTTEHRGLVTSEDAGVGSALGTLAATYDPDGALTAETYPNGLVATTLSDNTGNPTQLTYARSGSTWMTFTQASDAQGNTVKQSSPQSSQFFSYDTAGRLTQTQDTLTATSSCITRQYTLDADSNRTILNSYPAGTGGACSTSTTPTTTTSTFDGADRITNTGYTYDTLGRTSSVPSVDAQGIGSHAATTGTVTVGYYANDYVATQTQGAAALSFTLDPNQNRLATSSDGTTATTSHYNDDTDSPAWTSTSATVWTRNITGIDGGLAATVDQTGTVTLQLANLHGDIAATADDTTTATGAATYSESTEYGAPRTPGSAPDTYGWLGAKQRSSNDLAGLTLMGVRLYNPTTGRFLSVDPVPGGTDNPYVYVTNPTDSFDLNGMWWHSVRHWIWKHKVDIALTAASSVPVVGEVAWAVRGARFATWAARSRWVGTGSRLFGRGGSYGFKGILNRGPLRTGWGWNGSRNTFRTSIGWHPRQQTTWLRRTIGHHHKDWF
jgi:RHS repeat-associated protein